MIVYPILPPGLFWNSSLFWCICCFGTLHSCSVCLLATDHLSLEQGPRRIRFTIPDNLCENTHLLENALVPLRTSKKCKGNYWLQMDIPCNRNCYSGIQCTSCLHLMAYSKCRTQIQIRTPDADSKRYGYIVLCRTCFH